MLSTSGTVPLQCSSQLAGTLCGDIRGWTVSVCVSPEGWTVYFIDVCSCNVERWIYLSSILPHLDCIRINCTSSKLLFTFTFSLFMLYFGLWVCYAVAMFTVYSPDLDYHPSYLEVLKLSFPFSAIKAYSICTLRWQRQNILSYGVKLLCSVMCISRLAE